MNSTPPKPPSMRSLLWNALCTASIVGIWPRFIEPKLLRTSHLSLKISGLPPSLSGLKIVQICDLHINEGLSDKFLEKVANQVNKQQPDIIVLTGDFICYSKLHGEGQRLEKFLNSLHAPHGCYAVLGNHDYAEYVTVGPNGDYSVDPGTKAPISKAFSRLFKKRTALTKIVSPQAKNTPLHSDLMSLLQRTPFKTLHNETIQLHIGNASLNITGLGEYSLARAIPAVAFAHYNTQFPGIVLLHNPDGVKLLKGFPGSVVLCGHTHGGQVNLPWLWNKLTLMENMEYKRGLKRVDNKFMYINRGISGTLPFRWFAAPEILALTLESAP